jgi:hypothetical protein
MHLVGAGRVNLATTPPACTESKVVALPTHPSNQGSNNWNGGGPERSGGGPGRC